MFDSIAPRYDTFNTVLSAGVHHLWRRDALNALAPAPGRRYLDLCAGTLDLACAIDRRAEGSTIVGADFSIAMLESGRRKLERARGVHAVAADALDLPHPDDAFDGLIIGFGLRNLADFDRGLAEMRRVLAPGARLVVLEFTTPPGRAFRAAYHAYFHHVLPRAGALISGDADAARYLPDSVAEFPDAPELDAVIGRNGFERVRHRYLTRGIAALHTGIAAS